MTNCVFLSSRHLYVIPFCLKLACLVTVQVALQDGLLSIYAIPIASRSLDRPTRVRCCRRKKRIFTPLFPHQMVFAIGVALLLLMHRLGGYLIVGIGRILCKAMGFVSRIRSDAADREHYDHEHAGSDVPVLVPLIYVTRLQYKVKRRPRGRLFISVSCTSTRAPWRRPNRR